jgi:hypothetical protein
LAAFRGARPEDVFAAGAGLLGDATLAGAAFSAAVFFETLAFFAAGAAAAGADSFGLATSASKTFFKI